MTIRPRVASYAIDWPERIGGAAAGKSCVHCEPSHSHVSLDSPRSFGWMWSPPNKTVLPRCVSKAIDSQNRACGAVVVGICIQLVPSHSQVEELFPALPDPPNSTDTRRELSYAIVPPATAGGETAGAVCVQRAPSHCHVSWRLPGPESLLPPNRTLTPRAES